MKKRIRHRIIGGYRLHPFQALCMSFVALVICSILLLLLSPSFENFFGHDPSMAKTFFGVALNVSVLAFSFCLGGWLADENYL
jgi:chromate transport protein ChrA